MPQGDPLFSVAIEKRQIILAGPIQCQTPLLNQQHYRQGSGQRLGQRGQIENRGGAHRLPGMDVGDAVSGMNKDFAAAGSQEHGARKHAVRQRLPHEPGDLAQGVV